MVRVHVSRVTEVNYEFPVDTDNCRKDLLEEVRSMSCGQSKTDACDSTNTVTDNVHNFDNDISGDEASGKMKTLVSTKILV